MSDTNTQIKHPGSYLANILAERNLTQVELAFILGQQSANSINSIIQAKRGISPAMSKMLGEALHLSQDYFANLQIEYDLLLADEPDPTLSLRADILKTYPIREMIKRQWIKDGSAEVLQSELARFFEVSNTDEIPYLAHAAKRSNEREDVTAPQWAWLFRVREIAKALTVPKYSERNLRDAVEGMRDLLLSPEEARNVPRLLSECGVRFVIVETVPQAKIDGVCFWLDKQSPVIGMSTRYDRIDNFWFVLRHEIEHVLNKHGMSKAVVDDLDVKGDLAAEEVTANIAASDFCVPADRMESFMRRKYPAYYEKDILAFSKLHGIHPGLVVGQIQHKMNKYDYLRKYLVRIRHCVLPGSIVEGFGMSVPIRSAI